MDENYNPDIVSVVDEDGVEHTFEELDRIETDDARYLSTCCIFTAAGVPPRRAPEAKDAAVVWTVIASAESTGKWMLPEPGSVRRITSGYFAGAAEL